MAASGVERTPRGEYRMKLVIPAHLRSGDFALLLPPVSAALKISFNGKIVAERGKVSADFKYPQNSSEAFAWYPVKKEFLTEGNPQLLTLEMTGFQGGGGIFGNTHIYFGGIG